MKPSQSLIGTKVDRLTLIEFASSKYHEKGVWTCKCNCGSTIIVPTTWLEDKTVRHECDECKRLHIEVVPGAVIGNWTVLRIDKTTSASRRKWYCRCKCNTVHRVRRTTLLNGESTQCIKCSRQSRRIDIINQQVKHLIVDNPIGRQYPQKNAMYDCHCVFCKTKSQVSKASLLRGKVGQCTCDLSPKGRKKRVVIDLTGKKFGKWTVMYRVQDYPSKNNWPKPRWHCKCECNKEQDIVGYYLTSGKSYRCRSCVLSKDITNNQFGFMIADTNTWKIKAHSFVWNCHCVKCNKKYEIATNNLRSGSYRKCNCEPKEKKDSLPPTVETPNDYAKELIMMHHNGGSNNKDISYLLGFHVTTIKSVIRNYNHQN